MRIEDPIEKLLALTLAMRSQAKAGNWEQLMIIERQREKILENELANNSLKPVDAETLKQLRQLQDEIVEFAATERRQLGKTHQLSRSKIDVSQHYLGHSANGNPAAFSVKRTTDKEAG